MAGPTRAQTGDGSAAHPHQPAQPSTLRQSHTPSSRPVSYVDEDDEDEYDMAAAAASSSSPDRRMSEGTPLLITSSAHPGECDHGTFSPRASTPMGAQELENHIDRMQGSDDWKSWLKQRMRTKKMGDSSELAQRAGVSNDTIMYLSYYIPCLTWMRQYKLSYLQGDIVAAITMASFYLPMALSLAANLAHVSPLNGLYSFVFNPFIYAILGSSSQMVVGPEAAGSLLVGSVVKSSIDAGGLDDNDLVHTQIAGVVAGIAGAMVFIAGLARLGFLDSVLSRPFLRGFISAIGFVIAVDQLIPELGLGKLADESGVGHSSSVEKIAFILEHWEDVHRPTFAVAGGSFLVIMFFREMKRRLEPRYPSVVFVPDRFVVVVASAILCWYFEWDKSGVEILGAVKSATGTLFAFRWPFTLAHMRHIRSAMSTSFLIALLGFFESSVAAKSLGNSSIPGMELSANREMIALGVANVVGSCFMSLPAFGGYGRSKVNKTTGGKTPMSSIVLSLISLLSVLFLLPYFFFLPKPVLCSMISVVAWSLIEEAPHDIKFFVKIRGWTELGLMASIFLSTIFYSLTLGMALGVGISLLMVIKHSTRPRIQILGRIPGTQLFENAEAVPHNLEFVEGCLIVKIPEPLTFANTGELKSRLRRLELYGTPSAHPALPRIRSQDANRNIIFDIHGVTSIDGSGTQVLEELVRSYRDRGVRVFFSRMPGGKSHPVWRLMVSSGIVALCGESHFVRNVEEALQMTEYEESIEDGRSSVA